MGRYAPPEGLKPESIVSSISAGAILFRVHDREYAANSFNPTLSHRYFGGSRFDSTLDDEYSFIYAGMSAGAALSETLLKGLNPDSEGAFYIPRNLYNGRRISALEVIQDIKIVELYSKKDLSAIGQSVWLVHCNEVEYAQTRHWGHWLRRVAVEAMGVAWCSRQDPTATACVLFGDRVSESSFRAIDHPEAPLGVNGDFGTREGRIHLSGLLREFRAHITV